MKKPLSSLDLNLLLCLQLLTQELSVTRTAKRMNVSPSAVSKSLAKLRAWFDDPLFVKTPLGLSPTPLMNSMEQDLADWMQMGNQILDKPHHTMPSGLKFELAAESPLLEKIRVPFTLLWHKRNSYNPKIVWLRETLRQLYADPL